jgi:hypothetical protein
MGLFGEYLVQQGALTAEQLEETVRSQIVYGGRLGTSLLERGLLETAELAQHLSRYHGFPVAPPDWLKSPDRKASVLVPVPLIRRCKLLPLRVDQTTLHVAMLDPTNQGQIDMLQAAAGRSITAYVMPEVQLAYWLEVHHGIDRHPRIINLERRSQQRDFPGAEEIGASARPTPAAPLLCRDDVEDPASPQRDLPLPPGPESEEVILLEEIFAEPDPLPEFAFPEAEPEPVEIEERMISSRISNLEARLHAANERDDIVRLGLEIARSHSRATGLFLVRGGIVSGYRGDGEGMSRDLTQIQIPMGTASIFTHPALMRMPYRGEPPEDGIDGRLIEAMGRRDVREVVVLPIGIGDRIVNLLYADNGADSFGETSIAALTALCDGLARVYERVIMDRKKTS